MRKRELKQLRKEEGVLFYSQGVSADLKKRNEVKEESKSVKGSSEEPREGEAELVAG